MVGQANIYRIGGPSGSSRSSPTSEPEIIDSGGQSPEAENFEEVFGGNQGQTLEGKIIDVVPREEAEKIRKANYSNPFKEFYLQHIKYAKEKIKYAIIPTAIASAASFLIAGGMYGNDQSLMPATRINSERYESICRSILPEEMRDLNSQEAYDECSGIILNTYTFQKELEKSIEINVKTFDECNIKIYEMGITTALNNLIKCSAKKGGITLKRPKHEQPISIYVGQQEPIRPKPVYPQYEDLEELEEVREEEPNTSVAVESEEALTEEEIKAKRFFESQ